MNSHVGKCAVMEWVVAVEEEKDEEDEDTEEEDCGS